MGDDSIVIGARYVWCCRGMALRLPRIWRTGVAVSTQVQSFGNVFAQ